MSRTQKVQAENVFAVAHPLRRTACAHVGTTGWPCRMTSARSFCGRIAETSLQTIIALCCTLIKVWRYAGVWRVSNKACAT